MCSVGQSYEESAIAASILSLVSICIYIGHFIATSIAATWSELCKPRTLLYSIFLLAQKIRVDYIRVCKCVIARNNCTILESHISREIFLALHLIYYCNRGDICDVGECDYFKHCSFFEIKVNYQLNHCKKHLHYLLWFDEKDLFMFQLLLIKKKFKMKYMYPIFQCLKF